MLRSQRLLEHFASFQPYRTKGPHRQNKSQRPPQSDTGAPAQKKRFRVWARSVHDHYVDLHASSAADAIVSACRLDRSEFQEDPCWDFDWQIHEPVEIPEGEPFNPIEESRP